MLKYKVIIFDFDGVLAESVDVKTKAFACLFADYGKEVVQKVVDYHLKNGGVSRYEKFKYYYKEILKEPLSNEKLNELGERFSQLVVDEVVKAPEVKGANKFLERYYKDLCFYVVSGTPEEELKQIINKRNMQKYFLGVYGSPAKKGELIQNILKDNGYKKIEVMVTGDSITDYEAAKNAGVNFAGRIIKNDRNPFPADTCFVFEDFTDVQRFRVCVRLLNCRKEKRSL